MADVDLRPKLQHIGVRDWASLRDAWLDVVPVFGSIGASPQPGLERLGPPVNQLPDNYIVGPDIEGVRMNTLWEAVFLFHKCAHAHLASQRLGHRGMHSWSMFNAYHAAYLGARGIMALLGVTLPFMPQGGQLLLDVFPPPDQKNKPKKQALATKHFEQTLIVRFPRIDQRQLWQCLQRVLRMTTAQCWNETLRKDILDLTWAKMTGPRNDYLYRAAFWPGSDLIDDQEEGSLSALVGSELDVDGVGYLMRLSFTVYRLFEQLAEDLAAHSAPIRDQIAGSRVLRDPGVDDLSCYQAFAAGLNAEGAGV